MTTFIEKIKPFLVSEDTVLRKSIASHVRDYPCIPVDITNEAVKFGLEHEEVREEILLNYYGAPVNEESLMILLQWGKSQLAEYDKHVEWFVRNLPLEIIVKYDKQLSSFLGENYIDLCKMLHTYQGKTGEDLEPVWEKFCELLDLLEHKYNAYLYQQAKRVQEVLIATGEYGAIEVEIILQEEIEEECFYENGILAVRAVGLMQLHHLMPLLVRLLDRGDEDLLMIEVVEALIRLQSEDVVKAVAPYVADDKKAMYVISILKQIKTPLSEQLLVEAYPKVGVENKETIIDALVGHFSERAFPLIEDYLENDYYAGMFDMEEMFYGFYKAMNRDHPNLQQWQADTVEQDKRMEEDLATFDRKQIIIDVHGKVGRNDPCVCGSGKKFKKCCGK